MHLLVYWCSVGYHVAGNFDGDVIAFNFFPHSSIDYVVIL